MSLTQEQIKELKKQLSEQIKHLPADKRAQAQKQIDEMSPEALKTMLNQQTGKAATREDIFRMIVEGKIPAKKISENKQAIAVLDIRPISKGHVIIIPKNPIKKSEDMPQQAFSLAKKLAKILTLRLKAKGTEIQTEFKFGEYIINIIPHHGTPVDYTKRYDASEKELSEVQNLFIKKPKPIKIKEQLKEKQTSIIKLKRRIP